MNNWATIRAMSERTIKCVKLGAELPGLDAAPFDGELGEEIFQKVSKQAWVEWEDDMMIKIINEYRLNLSETEHYNTLLEQMRVFLNLSSSSEALEVHNEERGKEG